MKKSLLLILLLISPFSMSHAQDGGFLTIGAGYFSIDGDDAVHPTNALLRVGFEVGEGFEVGIESSTTVSEDNEGGFDFSADTRFIFVKANMPLGDNIKVYAMVGHSEVEFTSNSASFSLSDSDSGVGYGFGVQFERLRDASFFIDYISYYDDDFDELFDGDILFSSLNVGFVSYF